MKKGDQIYVDSAMFISRGSDDRVGGLATVTKFENNMVSVEEFPGLSWRWEGNLKEKQNELKKQFGENRAHPDPDIDRPWVEKGDILNGKEYDGPDIW